MKVEIWVTTQFVGFHSWEDAPSEVSFLKNKHRHVFKVKAFWEVSHDNREKEFFIQKNRLEKFIKNEIDIQNTGSCEEISKKIATGLAATKVFVSEDGENGAVTYKT